jgi:hypothetical protein
MKYVENSTGSAYFPKLLGTYEKELEGKILELAKNNYKRIVNVGGGEGYFAVGFARMFPQAQVVVFEPGFMGCHLIQKMAQLNDVAARVEIHAQLCMPDDLTKAIAGEKQTFIFMDVEGAELQLLDMEKVPSLRDCTIMVEIHDSITNLGDTILKRFSGTHKLTEIWQEDRTIRDLTVKSIWTFLFKKSFEKIMHEGRGMRMRWFVFEPLVK